MLPTVRGRFGLGFVDRDGQPIGPSRTVMLEPNHAASLDLNLTELGSGGNRASAAVSQQRVFVRPVVTMPDTDDASRLAAAGTNDSSRPGLAIETVEVFVDVTGAIRSVNTQDILPAGNARQLFGLMGLTLGWTLRVNVTAFADRSFQVFFVDTEGKPLAITPGVPPCAAILKLNPQQTGFVDLNADALLGNDDAKRVEVRPVVMPIEENPPSARGHQPVQIEEAVVELLPPGPCVIQLPDGEVVPCDSIIAGKKKPAPPPPPPPPPPACQLSNQAKK